MRYIHWRQVCRGKWCDNISGLEQDQMWQLYSYTVTDLTDVCVAHHTFHALMCSVFAEHINA